MMAMGLGSGFESFRSCGWDRLNRFFTYRLVLFYRGTSGLHAAGSSGFIKPHVSFHPEELSSRSDLSGYIAVSNCCLNI